MRATMSDKKETSWSTAITEIQPNRVAVRGYDIADLMGNVSFGQAVYLILRGELPSEAVGRLMDAIIVSSIDHGATPPSVLAARTVASTGGTLSASVAAGVMAINEFHGGAIEACARQLGHIIKRCDERPGRSDMTAIAQALIDEMKSQGERMSGFGHRVHTNDPRTVRLFDLADAAGVAGRHVEAARAVERVFRASGKSLPINVDGAIGAILADMGFAPEVMNGIFMIARVPGLVAHVVEEKMREKPLRRIDPVNHAYDGPSPRRLP
jgi:citrate synthase